jgi:hypothetical protein
VERQIFESSRSILVLAAALGSLPVLIVAAIAVRKTQHRGVKYKAKVILWVAAASTALYALFVLVTLIADRTAR